MFQVVYSRLHWRWFRFVSPYYWRAWPSLVLAHFRFLMDHVSGPCCSTCQFSIGTYVSCCGWVMCHFFIRPCVVFLLVHVAVSYSTTCHGAVHPCFIFLFGHVAWRLPSTCQIFISHVPCHGYFTCHALVRPRVVFLFDHVACPGCTTCSTINSS